MKFFFCIANPIFHQTLDARMKQLTSHGVNVGTLVKRAKALSEEEEEMLWTKMFITLQALRA